VASRLTVDLGALSRNFHTLAALAAPSECGAVVKANAYGLGAAAIASRLVAEGCTTFFVATVAEGIALREVIDVPEVYVLEGASDIEAPRAAEYDLVPVINTDAQLDAWRAYRSRPIAVQVDTGMNRLGFAPSDAHPSRFEGFELALLMTHLACAEEPEHPRNALQLERFAKVTARFAGVATSIANSAGILLGPQYRGDVCRPGVALYGASPFAEPLDMLATVATLEARILQLRRVPANEPIGYGATGNADSERLIATLGVGYADGLPRVLSGHGYAAVVGAGVPIVGRVSMDLTTIDVTGLASSVRIGDWVELIGAQVPIEDLAELAGTNSYEILTGLGARSERRYIG
jgi:alanine racemase